MPSIGRATASGTERGALLVQAIFFRFTLDSVGEISFGSNINSLKDPSVPFSNAFDHAQAVAEKRFWDPLWKVCVCMCVRVCVCVSLCVTLFGS